MKLQKIILLICTFLAVVSCRSKEPTEAELACLEMEQELADNPRDLDLVRTLMQKYFFETGNYLRIVELYETYDTSFENDVDAIVLYGAALCAQAGKIKDVEEQVIWVSKGMIVLDDAVETFPENPNVYIWRSVTYSNFPAILNARDLVLEDVGFCQSKIDDGFWTFNDSQLSFLYSSLLNVALIYGDRDTLEYGYRLAMDGFRDQSNPLILQFEEHLASFE